MRRGLFVLPSLWALFAPAVVRAEDTAELEGLLDQSVVSAASKTAETTSTAPATTISISADDLRRHGIRTVDEAINYLAMGMVTEKKFQTAEVGTRGVLISGDFGAHVLLLVDGHVISEAWGATAYFDRGTTIPFEIIDHIELVLGPGSVLYGSNAMLGVVNIVTKRAKDFSGLHLVVDSELPVSIREAVGFGREFKLWGKDAEVTFEAEYYAQKGPTFDFPLVDTGPDPVSGLNHQYSGGVPVNTWGGPGDSSYFTRAPAGYMRMRVGDFELGLRGALYNRSYPTDTGDFDDATSYETDRWLSADIKHRAALSETTQLTTRLYLDHYDYRQVWNSFGAVDCLEGQDNGCVWYLYGQANWIGLEPQLTFDWLKNRTFVTMIGLDGRLKQVRSYETYTDILTGQNPISVGNYDHLEKALAAYLQQTVVPAEWVALNAGARVDVDDRFGSHFSPRGALSFFPWKGGTLKGIYSEAFRAPSAFELYYSDPRTQLAGNECAGLRTDCKLHPEVVRSVEGSVEHRFGTHRILAGVFRSWWRDLVAPQSLSDADLQNAIARGLILPGTPNATQDANVDSIENYGVNVLYDGSFDLGRARYGASYTAAWTRLEEPGAEPALLSVSPRSFANAHISYDLSGDAPTIGLAARIVPRRRTDREDTSFAKPQFEMRYTITGPVPGLRGLSYDLTANIRFQSDSPYGTGYALPSGDGIYVPYDRFRTMAALRYDLPL